jgi:TPP-dependent 2-oxoacid decarboxylase
MWQYAILPKAFDDESHAIGIRVTTEEELGRAMEMAGQKRDKLVLIEACLPNRDSSADLERLGNTFRQAQQKG